VNAYFKVNLSQNIDDRSLESNLSEILPANCKFIGNSSTILFD